jgi:large subunit ribosomal protein L15
MDLNAVHQDITKHRKKKRVGRGPGSGHGKTSSRGAKGQWASAGAGHPLAVFEGGQMQLFRRIPKRGFSNASWARTYHVVNVGDLDAVFNEGDVIDAESLKHVGLAKGPADGVRILGEGEVTKKLTVKGHHFTKSAREKIEARGGTVEVIPGPKKPVRNKMGSAKKAVIAAKTAKTKKS